MNDVVVKPADGKENSRLTNQVLNSMETFDAITFKFQAVKYRGDLTPLGR